MSARAYLPADYSNAVVDALEELRAIVLRRERQALVIATDPLVSGNLYQYHAAVASAQSYRAVLDDIAMAIAKEQGR